MSCSVATDGVRALAAAASFNPQVGILDIGLPGMNGYELARHLRQSHPYMRLIALTGYGQPSDALTPLSRPDSTAIAPSRSNLLYAAGGDARPGRTKARTSSER